MKNVVAALDFGTCKIVTLIAENSTAERCNLLGTGICGYEGYLPAQGNQPGGFNDPTMLRDQIAQSIEDAEKQSKKKVQSLHVGVPAAFVCAYPVTVTVDIKNPNGFVTQADVNNAIAAAQETPVIKYALESGRYKVLHFSPAWFTVDNSLRKTLQPINLRGQTLTAYMSFLVGDNVFIEGVNALLTDMGYGVSGFYPSVAGEVQLLVPDEARDNKSLLIDVGYLTTDVMVCEGDAITFLKTIDIGGGNITAELAAVLDIQMENAEEQIKRLYKFGMDQPAEFEVTDQGGKPRKVTHDEVAAIIEPVVKELAQEIQQSLEELGETAAKLGSRSKYYVTGAGLGFNQNGRNYLGSLLGIGVSAPPVRTRNPKQDAYGSALGLMDLVMTTLENENQKSAGGFGSKVKEFFRTLLGG